MKLKSTLWIVCVIALFSGNAFSQMPSGQWYLIHQEMVKPSMVKEYEASILEFVKMVKANPATMPHFHFNCLQSDDFTYTYVVPIANMASIDSINADFKAMMTGSSGTKFMDLMKRGNTAISHIREWIGGEASELSYTPSNPRLKPEEMKFFHLDIYYIQAEKGMEAEALAKEFLELFKKKNIPDGYKIYMPILSSEMPAIVVRVGAKDAADFYAASEKNRATLGEEGEMLFTRAHSLTRRFETRQSWVRPDLSVPSPMEEKK